MLFHHKKVTHISPISFPSFLSFPSPLPPNQMSTWFPLAIINLLPRIINENLRFRKNLSFTSVLAGSKLHQAYFNIHKDLGHYHDLPKNISKSMVVRQQAESTPFLIKVKKIRLILPSSARSINWNSIERRKMMIWWEGPPSSGSWMNLRKK